MAEDIRRIEEGASYAFDGLDFTALPSCGESRGQWHCTTHGETFRNNFEKDSHIRKGEHVLAWVCLEHGLEVP